MTQIDKPGTRSRTGEPPIVHPRRPDTQAGGATAEALAAAHLQAQGLRIIARNVRCRGGEIDLICFEAPSTLVFVEVRLRRNPRFSSAAESIGWHKQQRIIRAARWWLHGAGRRYAQACCRFDAVLFDGLSQARLNWIQAAFDADGTY